MRITLQDTTMDIFLKLAEGNPGAINVMIQLMDETPKIDSDHILGGMGHILSLDEMEIYGPNIWVLYKDVCGESILNFISLLRGRQLGLISEQDIHNHMNQNQFGRGKIYEDMESLVLLIQEKLPNYNKVV